MSHDVTHTAGLIGVGASMSSGLMLWFGENATAIGAIVSITTLSITTIFLFLNLLITYKKYVHEHRRKDDK